MADRRWIRGRRASMMAPMVAFRFLALISVGFILLMFSALLNAGHGRAELEGMRRLTGPPLALVAGEEVTWTLDLGSERGEEAWPAPQRQPRLFLDGTAGADVVVEAVATYALDGERTADAFELGGPVVGAPGDDGALEFGALWMSWERPLRVTLRVVEGGGGEGETATPVLRGETTTDYVAARTIARTLWVIFSVIGAASFALLVATLRGSWSEPDPRRV